MIDIKVLKLSPIQKNSESRKQVVTNTGIFELVRGFKDPENKNGYYQNGQKIEDWIGCHIDLAIIDFLDDKRAIKLKIKNPEQWGNFKNLEIINKQLGLVLDKITSLVDVEIMIYNPLQRKGDCLINREIVKLFHIQNALNIYTDALEKQIKNENN